MASLPSSNSPDLELITYVGRHGVLTVDHVIAALGLPQITAYRHIASSQLPLLEIIRTFDLGIQLSEHRREPLQVRTIRRWCRRRLNTDPLPPV